LILDRPRFGHDRKFNRQKNQQAQNHYLLRRFPITGYH